MVIFLLIKLCYNRYSSVILQVLLPLQYNIHTYTSPDYIQYMSITLQSGLQQGGLTMGGRVRRESVEPRDLFHGHILAMDTFARALRNAARMIADGCFTRNVQQVGSRGFTILCFIFTYREYVYSQRGS